MRKYKPREQWYVRAAEYFRRLGKKRQKYYYRCGRCRKRKVLSKELWEYQIPPKCCRGVYWILDMDRYNSWKNKTGAYAICYCGNNTWDAKHKPGSILSCKFSKATLDELEQGWIDGRF